VTHTELRTALLDHYAECIQRVEHHRGASCSPEEALLVALCCRAFRTAPYNLDEFQRLQGWPGAARWSTTRDLATYDGDALLRLVIGAHLLGLRLSVMPAGARHTEIRLHSWSVGKTPGLDVATAAWLSGLVEHK